MSRDSDIAFPSEFQSVLAILDGISKKTRKIKELSDQIKQAKRESVAGLVRVFYQLNDAQISGVDCWPLLDEMYWSSKPLAKDFLAVFASLFGQKFVPEPRALAIPCTLCQRNDTEICTSWQAYSVKFNRGLCQICRTKERWRQQKEKEQREAQWREDNKERIERRQLEFQQYQEELLRLKTMPYREYLQTEHWQTVRKQALKRAGYACQLCNSREKLNVHHRTYENRGDERPWDLIALCEPCHRKHHDIDQE